MRPTYNRKTSPKVIGGHVQRKNNHTPTASEGYVVDRVRPGKGFKHVLTKKDIHDFTDLIPDWCDISEGIESVILDTGDEYADGYYKHYNREGTGAIWLSAWPSDLWITFNKEYFEEHEWLLQELGVPIEEEKDEFICHFVPSTAKAFMLLHVFLHELGHHVDKLRSRKKNIMRGGEAFAEQYANERFRELFPSYASKFGQP
tara:strand:+ start:16557 stop:17162 length:606 start_codon:yes stop_codon:yes gene_type:complete